MECGVPRPEVEFHFHPVRDWRFDFAWPEFKVALEVQGGCFVRGAHVRGASLRREHEKLNAAAALGWRVLYCFPESLMKRAMCVYLLAALCVDIHSVSVERRAILKRHLPKAVGGTEI